MFLKGKKSTNRRTNLSSSALPPPARGCAFGRFESKRHLLLCWLFQHTKLTHTAERHVREHGRMHVQLRRSQFERIWHCCPSSCLCYWCSHTGSRTSVQTPGVHASSTVSVKPPSIHSNVNTLLPAPAHTMLRALLYLVFNLMFNTISSRGHFPIQNKNLSVLLPPSPLCNLHGSWNDLPNIIVSAGLEFHQSRVYLVDHWKHGTQGSAWVTELNKYSLHWKFEFPDFPGGRVVTNPPANAGHICLIPGLGNSTRGASSIVCHNC